MMLQTTRSGRNYSDLSRGWPVLTCRRCERQRADYITSHLRRGFSLEQGVKALEGALAIGRQADRPGVAEVKTRMDIVQERATTATSVPDSPVFSKIASWLS
jgi:hypothetical protein